MITSIEIAKILIQQKRKNRKKNKGFDTAIKNLGIAISSKKKLK